MQEYDKSAKWLIQHYGGAILRLAGVRDIASWRALQAEPVQARRLPDGMLEVWAERQSKPDLYILEMATYPDARVADQAIHDALLVYLDRGILPEVLTLYLHIKGHIEAVETAHLRSPQGWTDLQISWRAVKLWEIPAEDLLAAGDVGLIPWVPLSKFAAPPEPVLRRCREIIDRDAPPDQHEGLLVVTQFLASLCYDKALLAQFFGGRPAMVLFPIVQDIIDETKLETTLEAILDVLATRLGDEAKLVRAELEAIKDEARMKGLLRCAATCPDLETFRKELSP